MISDTSRQAYNDIKEQLSDRQRMVFEYVKRLGPFCNFQIAKGLGWDINRVTPRVKELRDMGLLLDHGVKLSPTGKNAHFWKALEEFKDFQLNLL